MTEARPLLVMAMAMAMAEAGSMGHRRHFRLSCW